MVEIESHDYGGSLILPWYGLNKPSSAYYASHLSVHTFVISEVTRYGAKHKMFLYDERAAGKDADALCSLRFKHYITKYINARDSKTLDRTPRILFVILDNCVGQNKSQCVLKLFSVLTILGVYDRIVLHFLESGHSHGYPDIGYAHGKSRLKEELFVPQSMANLMNTIEGIDAKVIDFTDAQEADYTFRLGWDACFANFLTRIPNLQGITFINYKFLVLKLTFTFSN